MIENQIVTCIYETDIFRDKMKFRGVMGERLLKHDNLSNEYVIFEFNGKFWGEVEPNIDPMYIFVQDYGVTIILFNKKIYPTAKYFICKCCEKITTNKLKHPEQELCIHCFYQKNFDNPNRKEYDGIPMTLGRYIQMYERNHNMYQCTNPTRCFLCDYKKGKILFGINDSELIYKGKLIEMVKNNKKLEITI
jgi:hypothetical protein